MAQHNLLDGKNLHRPHRFEFADEAARLATVVDSSDLYHLGLQLDTNTYFLLVSLYPVTWLPINQITNTVLSGTGEPDTALGVDSDYYIDHSTYTLYGPKTAGLWPEGVVLKQEANTILSGVTPPTNDLGSEGDFYLDKVQYKFYGPKTAFWPAGVSLKADSSEVVITAEIMDSYDLNPADGTIFNLMPTNDVLINLGTFATAGIALTVIINQGLLPNAVAWSDNVIWPQGAEPEFLIPSSRSTITLFSSNGGVTWQGMLVGSDFKEANPEKYRVRTFLNLPAATWRCAEISMQIWSTDTPIWAPINWTYLPAETYLDQNVTHAAAITPGQGSGLGFDFTLSSPRDVHFFYKINVAPGDSFVVKIGAIDVLTLDGAVDWVQFRQSLAAGTHRMEIGYVKDANSTATGDFCNITWPILSKMSEWQPSGGSIFVSPGPNAVEFENVPAYEAIPQHNFVVDKHRYIRADYIKMWNILVSLTPATAQWKLRPGGIYAMNGVVPSAPLAWEETELTHESLAVYKAADIVDDQSTGLRINFDILTDNSSLKFFYKVSSELDYDFLTVYLDSVQIGQYSGVVDWTEFSLNTLTAGAHVLDFVYNKDSSSAEGEDTAWVTVIQISNEAEFVASGTNLEVIEGAYTVEFSTEVGYLPQAPITINLTADTTLNIAYTAE